LEDENGLIESSGTKSTLYQEFGDELGYFAEKKRDVLVHGP
jgi:hypothetical protein